MTTQQLSARVDAGAAFLDSVRPNWHRQIDTQRLDIKDSCNCVLGQLYGHFQVGVWDNRLTQEQAESWGFFADLFGQGFVSAFKQYAELTSAWKEKVTALQSADPEYVPNKEPRKHTPMQYFGFDVVVTTARLDEPTEPEEPTVEPEEEPSVLPFGNYHRPVLSPIQPAVIRQTTL